MTVDPTPASTTSTRHVLGLGALACIACCIGPILGVLGAIGVATMVTTVTIGTAGLLVALAAIPVVRRLRSRPTCTPNDEPVPLAAPSRRQPAEPRG